MTEAPFNAARRPDHHGKAGTALADFNPETG
jgi:hypothetical protein